MGVSRRGVSRYVLLYHLPAVKDKTDQYSEMLPFDIEESRFAEQQVKDQQERQGFPDDYGYRMKHSFQREEKRGERCPSSVKHPVKNDSE